MTFRNARRRWLTGLAITLVAALVAAGCGGSDDADEAGGGSDSAADVDPAGVLKIGGSLDITGGGPQLDPANSAIITDLTWNQLIYGTILRETPDGKYVPWMVDKVEVVDPSTIRITTRSDVKFTDGAAYDAKAVAEGLTRTRFKSGTPAADAGLHAAFKTLQTATAVDAKTVEIKLSSPIAGDFLTSLASREGAIVSPKQAAEAPATIATAPVGAGPYKFEKFEPLSILSLRKNAEFFDADTWKLGGVDWVHAQAGPAAVNGLLAGTVDWVTVPTESVAAVKADSRFEVHSAFTEFAYQILNFCSTKPPFNDANMRKGIQLALDRQEIADLVYGGDGEPAYGLWPEDHINFNDEVKKFNKHDEAAAKKAFAAAGVTPQTPITIQWWNATATGYEKTTEVIQAQLKPYGVNLEVHNARNIVGEFIQPQLPGVLYLPGSRTGYDKYGRVFLQGGQQALCGTGQSDVMAAAAEGASFLPGSKESSTGYQEAEELAFTPAWIIPTVQAPTIVGWSKSRVGGSPEFTASRAGLIFSSLYIKK